MSFAHAVDTERLFKQQPAPRNSIHKNKLFCPHAAVRHGADSVERMWVMNRFLKGVDRWLLRFAPGGADLLPTPQKRRRPETLRSSISPRLIRTNPRSSDAVMIMKYLINIDDSAAALLCITNMFCWQSFLPRCWLWNQWQ